MDTRGKDYINNENLERQTLCSKLGTDQDTPLSTKGRACRNFKIIQNPCTSMLHKRIHLNQQQNTGKLD